MGLLIATVALMFLGTALFATLIHIKNTRIMWVLGLTVLFAGVYLSYSADGVSFWSESVVSNTVIPGVSMMFYMLFLSMAIVYLLRGTKKIGTAAVFAAGVLYNVMLTGQHPSVTIATRKAGRIVQKCTAVNPDERYQTAAELWSAL